MKKLLRTRWFRLAIFGAGCLLAWYGLRAAAPPFSTLYPSSTAILDSEGTVLRLTLSSDQKFRLWTPLQEIAPTLIESTLLYEDKHFRGHLGFNPAALLKAFWRTYIQRDRRVGGSTISMQLARMHFGINSRNAWGKVQQILRAAQLELLYSKDAILEAYLNLVPYGGNIEGVEAASRIYFHKSAARLSLPESLLMITLPQNPSRIGREVLMNGSAAARLRPELIRLWKEHHPEDTRSGPELELPVRTYGVRDLPFHAPHFADQVLRLPGQAAQLKTTLNLSLQQVLERTAREYVREQKNLGIHNAAALLIDHNTMEIRSMLGSVDYFDESIRGQVNGTLAKRSPGSTLKPFVYALGLDQGLLHPLTMLKDTPTSFGGFDPENFDRDFAGPLTARDALIHSRNIPAVTIASRLHGAGFLEWLRSTGISRLRGEAHYGLSHVLGGAEVTMEELIRLYAALPQGGTLRPLRYLASERRDREMKTIFSPEAAQLILDILKDNPAPTEAATSKWNRDPLPVHWKTGTSFGFRDAWAAGVFGKYALVVWIGNFDGSSDPSFIGRDAAGPLFFRIANAIRSQDPALGVVTVAGARNLARTKVCAISGALPGPHCKRQVSTWFIPGVSPIHSCDIHRKIQVDRRTGLRACRDDATRTREEIFEFWPSDLLELYRQAGIPRRTPPSYSPECKMTAKSDQGQRPAITSPKDPLSYVIRLSNPSPTAIPLRATFDADAKELFWFVGDEFVGKAGRDQPIFWKARPGRHIVRVVDDAGRSDSRPLHVSVFP